jgi:hypothetical protein
MKIKSLFLFAILALISLPSLAKEGQLKIENKKIESTLGGNSAKNDDDASIKTFDFQKVFDEAERYFKASKAWKKLKCEPKSGFICTKKECAKRDSKVKITLDKKEQTITRCEGKYCETFPAEFKQTGVFFNIQTEGPVGTLIRVLGDSRYKEITTVGLDAYIANGNCEVIVD